MDTKSGCLLLTEGDSAEDVVAALKNIGFQIQAGKTSLLPGNSEATIRSYIVTKDDEDELLAQQVRPMLKTGTDWETVGASDISLP